MNFSLPLPQDKKLTVVFRVEPGCLGPQGADYIESFCRYAHNGVESIDSDFVHWELVPRYEKSLPEMQYMINNKQLTQQKAQKYLEMFNKNLDEFEGHFHDKLTELIEQYANQFIRNA